MRTALLLIGALSFVVAGCAGGTPVASVPTSVASTVPAARSAAPASSPDPSPTSSATAAGAESVDPVAADVVKGWLDAQNAGDLEKAATYFAAGARIGGNGLVTTHSVEEIVAALRPVAVCHHEIVGARQSGETTFFAVELSGQDCPFLAAGEATHEIEIPVQLQNGKIVCTCRPGE